MKELSQSQKQYEAKLEEMYADLINCNSPVDEGRKICNFFKDNDELVFIEENMVASGFPLFLLEVENFVANHYADCIEKKQLDTSENDFLKYVAWKTWQNKLFVSKFDEEKEKYKQEPRDIFLVYSENETVKELVDMATAKKNLYKATGKTKQVQLSLTEQSVSLQTEAKKDISFFVETLISKFDIGVMSKQELIKEVTVLINQRISEGYNRLHDSLTNQYQEKLNEIKQLLPMSETKQITGEQ